MVPVYLDIHIHTSENADSLNEAYNTKLLLEKVKEQSGENPFLISLTDHNTINKKAYLDIINEEVEEANFLLGVELHIRKYESKSPYHCHLLFNVEINNKNIDKLNEILDNLYPKKMVDSKDKTIPNIEKILNAFDKYEFVMLPHGGQSHRTFDKAVGNGVNFDSTMERSIYYNHLDGFTARTNQSIENTTSYFKKLGINDFINLITCSDNYIPANYPEPKAKDSAEFIPTWMYAEPTFDGFRLSLSESSRLFYGYSPESPFMEFIKKVTVKNEHLDIDVELTKGLNVVIGGSSSGKTLFVDLIAKTLSGKIECSDYSEFKVKDAQIENPSKMAPHYINQNFVIDVLQDSEKGIEEIGIISKIFPEEKKTTELIRDTLKEFKKNLEKLVDSVEKIEKCRDDLTKIPVLSRLITSKAVKINLFSKLRHNDTDYLNLNFDDRLLRKTEERLKELEEVIRKNPLAKDLNREFAVIRTEIKRLNNISDLNDVINETIEDFEYDQGKKLREVDDENQTKNIQRVRLIKIISTYLQNLDIFYNSLELISQYDVSFRTRELDAAGHKLFITNKFKLSKNIFLDIINNCLKREFRIESIDELKPETLFKKHFSDRPKVKDYKGLINIVDSRVNEYNYKEYKIVTDNNKNFETLSPGWRAAVILDLVLGYDKDTAPIIIDQPEDNLATDYINNKLVNLIKEIKMNKQIILASHNATIPMLGDARNIIVCKNEGGKIIIRSAPLEGSLKDKPILDYIAEITDGGKPSIKKRVKKYNLKSYRERTDAN